MSKIKSSKTVYNEAFADYALSSEAIAQLKKVILRVLMDVVHVCDKYSLPYFLGGGTFLGAVRHQGFIPWDDDIDINMFRADSERLPSLLNSEYGDKYSCLFPLSNDSDPIKFLKVMLKGTVEVEVELENLPIRRGVGIDIFPIENTPDSAFVRKMKGKLCEIVSKISSVCMDYKYPSKIMLDRSKNNADLAKYYAQRRRIGRFFSCISIKNWVKLYEKIAKSNNSNSIYVTIPSGMKGYSGEMMKRSMYEKTRKYAFESYFLSGVEDYDTYLRNLYSNYMEVPPEDKREKHILLELSCGEDNNE